MAPANCVTLPLPLHSGQTELTPARAPVPLHRVHASWRTTLRRTCVPRMACQKSMFSPYSRSVPFCGGGWRAAAPRVEDVLKVARPAGVATSSARGAPAGRTTLDHVGEIEPA